MTVSPHTTSEKRIPGQLKPMSPVVAVLHPGQMGAAVGGCARQRGAVVLWCTAGRGRETVRRAREADLAPVRSLDELVARADVIVAICPSTVAQVTAESVASLGFRGVYVEANAISPGRYQAIAELLGDAGATVVDACIIGLPPTVHSSARLYLSGHPVAVRKVAGLFAETAVEAVVLGERPGAASALKMSHVSYQRAVRALAGVAHALAAEFDVTAPLLAEAGRESGTALAEPEYLAKAASRALRTAPELLEAADALVAAGLPPHQAQAAHHVLALWGRGGHKPGTPLDQILAGLRESPADTEGDTDE